MMRSSRRQLQRPPPARTRCTYWPKPHLHAPACRCCRCHRNAHRRRQVVRHAAATAANAAEWAAKLVSAVAAGEAAAAAAREDAGARHAAELAAAAEEWGGRHAKTVAEWERRLAVAATESEPDGGAAADPTAACSGDKSRPIVAERSTHGASATHLQRLCGLTVGLFKDAHRRPSAAPMNLQRLRQCSAQWRPSTRRRWWRRG